MRDERRQPRLRAVDDDGAAESVRPRSWLHHPLTRKVKAAATLLGAVAAISGYLAGVGAKAIKWAGVATVADLAAQQKSAEEKRQADNKVDADRAAAVEVKLDAMTKELRALRADVLASKRKRARTAPETKEGDREQ